MQRGSFDLRATRMRALLPARTLLGLSRTRILAGCVVMQGVSPRAVCVVPSAKVNVPVVTHRPDAGQVAGVVM